MQSQASGFAAMCHVLSLELLTKSQSTAQQGSSNLKQQTQADTSKPCQFLDTSCLRCIVRCIIDYQSGMLVLTHDKHQHC
jgi:hypothetical protein